jgi:hypothetical protein
MFRRECIWPGQEADEAFRPAHTVGGGNPRSRTSCNFSSPVFSRRKRSGRRGSSTYKRRAEDAAYADIINEWPEDRESPVDGSELVERNSENQPWEYLLQRKDFGHSANNGISSPLRTDARIEDGLTTPTAVLMPSPADPEPYLPSSGELNEAASVEFRKAVMMNCQVLPQSGGTPEQRIKSSCLMQRRQTSTLVWETLDGKPPIQSEVSKKRAGKNTVNLLVFP